MPCSKKTLIITSIISLVVTLLLVTLIVWFFFLRNSGGGGGGGDSGLWTGIWVSNQGSTVGKNMRLVINMLPLSGNLRKPYDGYDTLPTYKSIMGKDEQVDNGPFVLKGSFYISGISTNFRGQIPDELVEPGRVMVDDCYFRTVKVGEGDIRYQMLSKTLGNLLSNTNPVVKDDDTCLFPPNINDGWVISGDGKTINTNSIGGGSSYVQVDDTFINAPVALPPQLVEQPITNLPDETLKPYNQVLLQRIGLNFL